MAIYQVPELTAADHAVITEIEGFRNQLRFSLVEPRRWHGTLRRATFARAVQGSNSIEGYHATVADVAAMIDDEEPVGADAETRLAITGYRDAMTYVLQIATAALPFDASTLRSLHFMMLKYDLAKHPGQWRPGAVWVADAHGDVVYTAPDRELVAPLVAELIDQLNEPEGNVFVRAAMAHLNLVLIHPFSDGNGRMARCVQTLALAGAGHLSPEFSSIEEYLGRNTDSYYRVLTEVARGHWSPERSAHDWIRYCLTAHHRQAQTVLSRLSEAEELWLRCEELVARFGLPARSIDALCDVAQGRHLRRSAYVKVVRNGAGEEITDATATRDLRALTDAGLLDAIGDKRGRTYGPSGLLATQWHGVRRSRHASSGPAAYESNSDHR